MRDSPCIHYIWYVYMDFLYKNWYNYNRLHACCILKRTRELALGYCIQDGVLIKLLVSVNSEQFN